MSITTAWAELRFLFDRATGLCRRGVSSLRTRGWRASWQRVCVQLRRVPAAQRADLYLPAATPFAPFAVPASDAPRASIVIPVYNQFAHTLACLRAIAAHPPQAAVEVIVVDDGSSDETPPRLQQVIGAQPSGSPVAPLKIIHAAVGNADRKSACRDRVCAIV